MFFDQVEVITAAVESEHRHLVTPFCELLALCQIQKLVERHKIAPYDLPDVFTPPFQLFHESDDQLLWVRVADMLRLTLERVAYAH